MTVAFSIGGDWTWTGTTTFSGPVVGVWGTSGNSGISGAAILGTLDNKTLFIQVNGSTILECDSPGLDITMGVSTAPFTLNCSGGGINAIGISSNFSIDSDSHLLLGANNAPAVTIGTAAWTAVLNLWSTNCSIGMGTDLEIQAVNVINIGTGTPSAINFGAVTCPMSINATTFTVTGAGAASISTSTGNLLLQTAGGDATLATTTGGDAFVNSNGSIILTANVGFNFNGVQSTPTYTPVTPSLLFLDTGASNTVYTSSINGAVWLTTGNTGLVAGKVGTLDAQAFDIVYDNNDYISLVSAGLILTAPDITIEANAANITISADSGQMILVSPAINVNISPSAHVLTIGNAFLGNNLVVNSNSVTISPTTFIMNTVNTLHLGSGGAGDFSSGTSVSLEAPAVNLNTASSTNVTTIGNVLASNNTVLNSVSIRMPNLGSSTTSKIVYIDDSTGLVSKGAAPAAALSWSTVSGTSQTMVARNAYVSGNVALITFTLPVTAAVGDEFMVQGNSAGGWKIVYNSGQNIQVGNVSSTVTTGDVSSSNRYDVIKLVCTVADTSFNAEFLVGSLSIT